MKLLFWNIGPDPTAVQLAFVDSTIRHFDADIVCISEGTPNGIKCATRVTAINGLGYSTIYEPNFHSTLPFKDTYGFNKNGLKVFKKNGVKGVKKFAFWDQNLEGRVLLCRFKYNAETYSCFFIHNMSKVGDEIKQYNFMIRLNMYLASKRRMYPDDKFFIYGDFNLLPWEKLLRKKETVKSYFFDKEHSFFNAKDDKSKYFNPFFEYCLAHGNKLMFATHHGSKYTSLIDFALFQGGMKNFDIEIVDKVNGVDLLSSKRKKITILNQFDHLPILVTLK